MTRVEERLPKLGGMPRYALLARRVCVLGFDVFAVDIEKRGVARESSCELLAKSDARLQVVSERLEIFDERLGVTVDLRRVGLGRFELAKRLEQTLASATEMVYVPRCDRGTFCFEGGGRGAHRENRLR